MNKKHDKLERIWRTRGWKRDRPWISTQCVYYESIHEMPNKQNVDLVKTELIQYNSVKENQNKHCNKYFQPSKSEKNKNFVLWMALSKASNWAWVAVTWSNSLFGNISTSGQHVFRRSCHITQTKSRSKFRWHRKRKKFNKLWSVHFFPY